MTRFRFRLQSVLELRRRAEDEKARALSEARVQAEAAEEARAALEESRAAGQARLARAHGKGGTVGHLQNLAYVLARVDDGVRAAEEGCRAAEEHVQRSIEEYGAAFAERRTLDRLRDRRHALWQVDEGRREQKHMDEVALGRRARSEAVASDGAKAS